MFTGDKVSKDNLNRSDTRSGLPKTPMAGTHLPRATPPKLQLQQVPSQSPHAPHHHQLSAHQHGGIDPLHHTDTLQNLDSPMIDGRLGHHSPNGSLGGILGPVACGDVKVKLESATIPPQNSGVVGGHFAGVCSPPTTLMTPPITPGLKSSYDNINKPYENMPKNYESVPSPHHPMLGGFQMASNHYPYGKHILS